MNRTVSHACYQSLADDCPIGLEVNKAKYVEWVYIASFTRFPNPQIIYNLRTVWTLRCGTRRFICTCMSGCDINRNKFKLIANLYNYIFLVDKFSQELHNPPYGCSNMLTCLLLSETNWWRFNLPGNGHPAHRQQTDNWNSRCVSDCMLSWSVTVYTYMP